MLLMDKSGPANHKLTVGKRINMFPFYQQNSVALFPQMTVAGNDALKEVCFPFVVSKMKKNVLKHLYLNEVTQTSAFGCLVPWTIF